MALGLIVLLIGTGIGSSWGAVKWAARAPTLETVGGALLIAGLALLGLSMPLAHHLTSG